jgi:large subunit ribosomal protein L13
MRELTHSTLPLKESEISRGWHLIDARGKILGRFATQVSEKLIGKHKSNFVSNMDNGDYVVVINAKDLKVTGRKLMQKVYTRYSGYPGGLKKTTLTRLMDKDPRKVVQNAVSGMLPKNKLRAPRMTRLYVFSDEKHPYTEKFESKNN